MKITGKFRIWKKEWDSGVTFSASFGKKRQDGDWDNAYLPVKFKRGEEPVDSGVINITDGFLSFYTKDGQPRWYLMAMDYNEENIWGSEKESAEENIWDEDDIPF